MIFFLLYNFDDALRDLVFKYIRIIEQEMRSHISYHFCEMYSLLSPSLKSRISKHFSGVSQLDLTMHLRLLTHFRNVCAHNERLFSYKDRYDIPDTVLHKKLNIPMRGQQYVVGKKDMFSVVISFRYLLSDNDFFTFKKALNALIQKTVK